MEEIKNLIFEGSFSQDLIDQSKEIINNLKDSINTAIFLLRTYAATRFSVGTLLISTFLLLNSLLFIQSSHLILLHNLAYLLQIFSFWLRQGAQEVKMSVCPVLVCLKLLIFIFWAQTHLDHT